METTMHDGMPRSRWMFRLAALLALGACQSGAQWPAVLASPNPPPICSRQTGHGAAISIYTLTSSGGAKPEPRLTLVLAAFAEGGLIYSGDLQTGGEPYFTGAASPEAVQSFSLQLQQMLQSPGMPRANPEQYTQQPIAGIFAASESSNQSLWTYRQAPPGASASARAALQQFWSSTLQRAQVLTSTSTGFAQSASSWDFALCE